MSLFKKLFSLFNGVANRVGGGDKVSKKCEKRNTPNPRFSFEDRVKVIGGFYKGQKGTILKEHPIPHCRGTAVYYDVYIKNGISGFTIEVHSTLLEKVDETA